MSFPARAKGPGASQAATRVAPRGRMRYPCHMRGRRHTAIVWNIVLIFCALSLIVAVVALGAGMMAVIAMVATLHALASLAYRGLPLTMGASGRTSRLPLSRAPPID